MPKDTNEKTSTVSTPRTDHDSDSIQTMANTSWFGSLEPFNEGQTAWESYIERMDQFFEINNVPDDKKHHFLLMFIGQNSYDTLRDICQPHKPASKTYKELVVLMKNHLQPKPSVLSERYKFHKVTQAQGQSVSDFVLSLKRAAQDCDFENRDISLRDQFVAGLTSDSLKKRLFTEAKLTFNSAVEISLAWEAAEHDVAVVHIPSTSVNYSTSKVQTQKKISASEQNSAKTKPYCKPNRPNKSGNIKFNSKPNGTLCTCCGYTNHTKSKCRYLNYACNFCKVKGHLIAVCPKKNPQGSHVKTRFKHTARHNCIDIKNNESDSRPSDNNFLEESFENISFDESNVNSTGMFNVSDNFFVNSFSSCNKPKPVLVKHEAPFIAKVEIDDKLLNMEIDTGSPISAISNNIYKQMFSRFELHKNELSLKSYDGSMLNPLGYIKVNAKYNNCIRKSLDLYVFENGGVPLLGRNWLKELNVTLSVNQMFDSDVNNLFIDFPNVFSDKLGTFVKRKISLRVKPGTIPVYCKPRPVPFALQDKVNNEIDSLVRLGILEPIDICDWGTPIVTIPKKDGNVRICGDFSVTVNPNLQVERYPLPKIENLLAKLSGSVYFSKLDLRHAYHQLLLDDESKKLTTVSTNKGLYCYTRIPYGITSGPYVFQKIIDLTLLNLGNVPVAVFQDDVIIGEPMENLLPADVQHYGDWQSKYIDHWTPEDCLFWVIHELHNLKVGRNLPEVKIEKMAHINGTLLKHMTVDQFCQNFPDHGKELYVRLQKFKTPYLYNSMFPVDHWSRQEDEYSRYRMEQPQPRMEPSQPRLETRMDTSSPAHENHTLTDLDESHSHSHSFSSSPSTVPPYSSPSEVDSGYKSDSSEEATVTEPPPPPEKRRPGRPRGTRRKKKPEKLGRLWEFIRDLLLNPMYNPSLICWENYDEGTFRFVHSDRVAKLWGSKKDNIDMNYEKLSRAMRYYYKSQVLLPVYGKRLVYKFGPTATGWRSERPIFRQG